MGLFALLLIALLPPGRAGEHPQDIDQTTLYILFFRVTTPNASSKSPSQGMYVEARANNMGVTASDVLAIDTAANAFSLQDQNIAKEARDYYRSRVAAGMAAEPSHMRSLTERRRAAAEAVIKDLRAKLSPSSFSAFQRFISSKFRRSVEVMK